MATVGVVIPPVAPGDAWDVDHSIIVPDGIVISSAKMALKAYPWDTAPLVNPAPKTITTTPQPNIGQILNTGGLVNGKQTIEVLFQFSATDTAFLVPGRTYNFWIEVTTSSGAPYTAETGTWSMLSSARLG